MKTTGAARTTTRLWGATALEHVAQAAWTATRDERVNCYHRGNRCPTRSAPYGVDDPYGHAIHEARASAGCIDLLHDVIARVLTKLDASTAKITDLAAYCYRIACREVVEVKRVERTSSGLPARPSRSDGVAGRVNAGLRSTGNGTGEWLVVLFRIMRTYPYSSRRAPGRWPISGLARERAALRPDEDSSPQVIRDEVSRVLTIAKEVAGHDWVYTNLTLPLQAHGAHSELPDTLSAPSNDAETTLLCAQLKENYQRLRRAGVPAEEAFGQASVLTTGLPAPRLNPELAEALEELEPQMT